MPPKKKSVIPSKPVRLELFDIQGHNGDSPLDYEAFFRFIAAQTAPARQERVADRIIAVPIFRKVGDLYTFVAYSGTTDRSFLVLDIETQEEEVRQIERGKVMATRTVGVIDPVTRRVAVQFVFAGVRSAQIAALFEKLANSNSETYEGATLEFAPRAGESFRDQLAQMERIQRAEMTLTRPNYDWTDYDDQLASLAQDSKAQRIEVSAAARPRESLVKSRGVVQLITRLATGGRSILKSAKIVGYLDDDSAPIQLNLTKHIESKTVAVAIANDGLPSTPQIQQAGMTFIEESNAE